ncbi:hypothetical protein [Micromonospora aurantiaca (nom. illeg.)]|uniref:hypothetical protein n=1 Tax=Micromonospora aurantiaca (nom. illeg.) TaxID=47850 RepID=UPI003F4A6CF8
MALNSKLAVAVQAAQTGTLDLGTSAATIAKRYAVELASGTGAGQADRVFHDQRTLAASATEDLDLSGVLLDAFGATLAFARIKGLIVAAAAGNVNDVIVGGAAANAITSFFGAAAHTLRVRPGGVLALIAGGNDAVGYTVVPATGDLLRVGNGGAGTPVTYDIAVIGTSA